MGARDDDDDDDGTTSWRSNVVVVATSLGGAAAATTDVCDGAAGVVLAYGFRIITIRIINNTSTRY